MAKRFFGAGVFAVCGLWAPFAAQASTLELLQGLANVPAAEVATPAAAAQAGRVSPAESALDVIWRAITADLGPERRRFMNQHVSVVVVPRDMLIVDKISEVIAQRLPPAQAAEYIQGVKASYADRMNRKVERVPQSPRGFTADYPIGDGQTICFVGEENLVGAGDWDQNGSRMWRLAVHELGHAVRRTLTDADLAFLKSMAIDYYADRPDPKDRYRDGDENELFAMFTEIWFGVNQTDLNREGWDETTAPARYAPMMRFLERIYGPPRHVRG
jgi:hypothetical protein